MLDGYNRYKVYVVLKIKINECGNCEIWDKLNEHQPLQMVETIFSLSWFPVRNVCAGIMER